jgi:hypothetical protein
MAADAGISKDSASTGISLVAIIVFISLALYNVVELHFIIFMTFKNRKNLYFWSFVVSTWGIALYGVGFLIKALQPSQLSNLSVFYVTLIVIGWCSMVTGQSVVLYSRLHIVLRNRRFLRAILIMIIVDALLCHIPIIVMVYGANSNNPEPWIIPYSIYEKVQVTIFFVQELIISGLYISKTIGLLRIEATVRGKSETRRRTMTHLIYVNIIIVILDVTILALEYAGLYDIQTAYKALVYSVKLKLEFSILNRLVELTQSSRSNGSDYAGREHQQPTQSRLDKRSGGRSVPLRPLDGTELKHKSGDPTWTAFVHTGSGLKNRQTTSEGVIKTTEVVIKTDSLQVDADSERDLESIEGRARDSELNVSQDRKRGISASSSEVQFARAEY